MIEINFGSLSRKELEEIIANASKARDELDKKENDELTKLSRFFSSEYFIKQILRSNETVMYLKSRGIDLSPDDIVSALLDGYCKLFRKESKDGEQGKVS